ncbi:MAG: thiamine phosphate synthase [Holophaga sp.]|jgi:thiamine monophosphate synthase
MFILAISPGEGFQTPRWDRLARSGIDALMIREPDLEPKELLAAARWVRHRFPGLELWINGRLDVALAAGCGLHAPEAHPFVPPGLVPLSRPVHDPAQIPARATVRQLIVSPIFPVPGKGPAWGPGRLHLVLHGLPPLSGRLLALGGITPANAAWLKHPRLDGVALVRSLWDRPDPETAVAQLRAAWKEPAPASARPRSINPR